MGKMNVQAESPEVDITVSVGTDLNKQIRFYPVSPSEIQLQVYSVKLVVKIKTATKEGNGQTILIV